MKNQLMGKNVLEISHKIKINCFYYYFTNHKKLRILSKINAAYLIFKYNTHINYLRPFD